jgi:tryptophan-rich sensory protein
MGILAWRVWRLRSFEATRRAFAVFGIQLYLNLACSFLFCGFQRIDLALLEIIILLIAIITNAIVFWDIKRLAGLLFVP